MNTLSKKSDKVQISLYDKNDARIVFVLIIIILGLLSLLAKDSVETLIAFVALSPLLSITCFLNFITIDSDSIYINKFFKKEISYKVKNYKKIYQIIPFFLLMIKFKNGDYFYFMGKADDTWKKFIED